MKLSQAIAIPFHKFYSTAPVRRLTRRSLATAAEAPAHLAEPGEAAFWLRLHQAAIQQLGFGGGTRVNASGERAAAAFLSSLLPAAPILFDVGANRGDYTRMLAELFPQSRIHSFEPSRATYALLTENVAAIPQARTFNFGLSSQDGEASFFSDHAGSGLASLYHRQLDHRSITMQEQERVQLRTLPSFCGEAGVEQIDFLKIDVEGHELEVLSGAREWLDRDRIGAIQFEFGGCNIDSRTFFRDFYDMLNPRYAVFRIVGRALLQIDRYREEDEVFITTNYLALNRARHPAVLRRPVIRTAA